MIPRLAHITVQRLAKGFPILALTGPRQSGKTTLARSAFPAKPYVSLENPEERHFAQTDPKRFLSRFPDGAIIDEVQRVPLLLSWLQQLVDERKRMADFVLTGSAQFDLMAGITQSLAGRVGRIELLPFSSAEVSRPSLDEMMFTGGYPALYDRELSPLDWFPNYVSTYLERDVRQLLGVRDLSQFQRFVSMCAARSGQLLNLSGLGNDCGISSVTAKQWLSVLESSYLVRLLQPYHRNFGKRLVKTPKLYFLDVGLMAWLLGIRDQESLATHSARGALFETWVVSELIKQRFNQGQPADLFFWRDSLGHEVDIVYETPMGIQAIETKSGSTWTSEWLNNLQEWQRISKASLAPIIIYGGDQSFQRQGCQALAWSRLRSMPDEAATPKVILSPGDDAEHAAP
jgi:uncharacterized protein